MGSGLWMPDAEPLRLLRRNVDRKPEKIREVLTEANLRKQILGGVSNDEKKTIKAFASQNTENALKTKPKVGAISPGPISPCAQRAWMDRPLHYSYESCNKLI